MSPPDEGNEAVSPKPPSPEVIAAAEQLLANVELLDIRPTSLAASVVEGVAAGAAVETVSMDVGVSFATGEGTYGNLVAYRFELRGEDEAELGAVEFTLVLDYGVTEGFVPDAEAAEFVASTTGYFAAYPYARELFQSLASRLQFDPVVLGMIRRGTMQPGSVTVALREALHAADDGE